MAELAELRRALASCQQQLQATREQLEALKETDARRRRKLIRLAEKSAQARHFAYHDQSTGLPNRSLLLDRLTQAMIQANRQHRQLALLFLDLNGFKAVNDKFGHAVGDELLRQVSERLTSCIRGGDTACRYGGDEFIVMLPEIDGGESAASVAEKIRIRLAAPYVIDGNSMAVTASIGTAIYPSDGNTHAELIRQADIAMYLAKAASKRPFANAEPEPVSSF